MFSGKTDAENAESENIWSLRDGSRFQEPPSSADATTYAMRLRLEFVEVVERVLQWHASHAAEARRHRELLQLPFWQTHRAQPLAMAGERGGHAIEHTEAIEQAPQRPGIAFQVLGAIDVQAHIASIRAQRLANGPQQPTRVDGIVDDIKGGDHIILFGQACGHVALLEAHPVGDPRCLSMCGGLCDSRLEDVIADIARAREG